jgi:hypothetical protein
MSLEVDGPAPPGDRPGSPVATKQLDAAILPPTAHSEHHRLTAECALTGESGRALLVPQIAADMSQLDAALAHASAGIHVFPADHPELPQCAGVKTAEHDPTTCDKRGKHPVVKWDTGASTSPQNIAYWWAGSPRNIGIHCGKSGLLVIDEDASGEFARFAADLGVTPPDTYTVTTASGKHYYFQDTEAGALGNREGAFRDYHINVRSGRGYVIAAGSVHETGITYAANRVRTIAPLPEWVREAIQGQRRTNGSDPFTDSQGPPEGFELPKVIKEGHRDEVLYRFACSLRAQTLNYPTAKLLFQEAFQRCEQPPTAETPFTWDQALAKLKGAYGRYDEGRSDQYAKTRRIRLTPASTIKPRPVRWTWTDRIPAGELTLTPGRGGVGKSTFHAWAIANLTRGTLPGVHFGKPKPCIIAASEDSWERTIVPRLLAAGADMDLVYRVDVITETDELVSISLPRDIEALTEEIIRIGAALLSVDPVMSVLSSGLDTHKDREVRLALEPLGRLADRTGCAALGNAHFNNSTGLDPLSLIMGSAAFGNVARAALGFARDTEAEDGSCVISQVKNNLGRLDLPSLRYRIESVTIDTDEGPADVGKLAMLGESDRSLADILSDQGNKDKFEQSEHNEIDQWLIDYLTDSEDGQAHAADVITAAKRAGFSENAVKKARRRIKAKSERTGFGKDAYYTWVLMDSMGSQFPKPGTHGTHGESMDEAETLFDDQASEA